MFITWVLFPDNYSMLVEPDKSGEVVCEWSRLWKQNTCIGESFWNPSTKGGRGRSRVHGQPELHSESNGSLGYMKLCFKKAEIV